MHGNLTDDDSRATSVDAGICSPATIRSPDCKDVQEPLWFGLLCRFVWPTKPWLMLQQIAGCKERTAHNYASGSCPPADILRDILRSDYGFLVLKWLMRDDPPDWWRNVEDQLKVAAIAKEASRQINNVTVASKE